MKLISLLKATAFAVSVLLANSVNAAVFSPVGLWQLDQYDFVSKAKINTVYTCIKADGTAKQGDVTMFNVVYNGNWKQNGDLLLIRFNNIDYKQVGTYSLIASNAKLMTGYNQSWNMTSGTSNGSYVSVVWTLKNSTC